MILEGAPYHEFNVDKYYNVVLEYQINICIYMMNKNEFRETRLLQGQKGLYGVTMRRKKDLVGKLSSKCMCLINVLHCNKRYSG